MIIVTNNVISIINIFCTIFFIFIMVIIVILFAVVMLLLFIFVISGMIAWVKCRRLTWLWWVASFLDSRLWLDHRRVQRSMFTNYHYSYFFI